MPDGTVQDSRNPYSPQWGYLKVKNGDVKFFDDKDILSLFHDEPVVDVGDKTKNKKSWNQYVLFIHNLKKRKKKKTTKRFKRGDKVKFELVEARLEIDKKARKKFKKQKLKKKRIYVALVTEQVN